MASRLRFSPAITAEEGTIMTRFELDVRAV
jgi:hypothetical protein